MTEQVIIGRVTGLSVDALNNPELQFRDSDGRTYNMPVSIKGVWQFLRYEYGRAVDAQFKEWKEDDGAWVEHRPIAYYAVQRIATSPPPNKEMQILIKDGKVMTVASTKHMLTPSAQVYALIQRNLIDMRLVERPPIMGRVIYIKELGGLKMGVVVYAGDIFTEYAIKFATFIEVTQCMNPLSFLSLGKLPFTPEMSFERILRITKESELNERIGTVLKKSIENVDSVLGAVERSRDIRLTNDQALKLVVCSLGSYRIGLETATECYHQYLLSHGSLWQLSMAISWVAQHSEKCKKETKGCLASIAGSLLLIDNLDNAITGCNRILDGTEAFYTNQLIKKLYMDLRR